VSTSKVSKAEKGGRRMETSEIHPAQESLAWGSEKKLPADED
jgi:hypothetical protein